MMFQRICFVSTLVSSASAFSPMQSSMKTTKIHADSLSSDLIGEKDDQKTILDPMGLYPKDSQERQMGLIQSLEPSVQLMDQKTIIDPLSLYSDKSELTTNAVMSASLPFLKRPALLDGSLPGDRGFDPLNFSSDASALDWYRNAEIKHARLAMLATVGWPIAELTHKSVATQFDLESTLGLQDKAPSVLNGGLGLTNPLFWIAAISAAAALEFIATKNGDSQEPGDFGFDPLSFTGANDKQTFFVQEAEIFNGRLAMLAITGFVVQEFYTNTAVINETPLFFKPFGSLVEQLLGAGGATSI